MQGIKTSQLVTLLCLLLVCTATISFAQGGAISVVAGTYGGNCRALHGNMTRNLAETCNGRPDCAYKVDLKVLGADPRVGCKKDYVAEWRCGQSPEVYRVSAAPEAGYGSVVTLACRPAQPPVSGAISVVAGTYGGNCRAPHGNMTRNLAETCNGRPDCAYKVDLKVLGVDPRVGCKKDYVAEWRCGQSPEVYRVSAAPEAGYGSVVTLACRP